MIHHYLFDSFPIKHNEYVTQVELELGHNKNSKHDDNVVESDPSPDWIIVYHQMSEWGDQNKKGNWYNYEGMKESQCHV